MPGFLIFEEFGATVDNIPSAIQKEAAKAALRRLPGSWMMHGIAGEQDVDIDPVAELNKALDGEGVIGGIAGNAQGAAESAASGDAAGVVEGVANIANTFFNPYKGWIPVASVGQQVESTATAAKRDLIRGFEAQRDSNGHGTITAPGGDITGPPANVGQGEVFRTQMKEESGVEFLDVTVHLDVSFPKVLKMALKPSTTGGKATKSSAELHLCTNAVVDMSQVTLGNNSPAARMIQTLLSFNLNNVVPYLSIHMSDVSVAKVRFGLPGETQEEVPTVDLQLQYEKIKWTYHILNGSNMNLFDVDFAYDIRERKPVEKTGLAALADKLNPFITKKSPI